MANRYAVSVVVGRWQIFHKGHETLLRAALDLADKVIVVIGSAYRARDIRNPFTWQERAKMIELALPEAERERISFLPVRDYFNDLRWNTAVENGVRQRVGLSDVVLVGHKKDDTSYYLNHFPAWHRHDVAQQLQVDATELRRVYFESPNMPTAAAVLEQYVRKPVVDYLQAWSGLNEYEVRRREHLAVSAYKTKWTADFYLTADALVRVGDHVLLVQRGGEIGYGQWALPGGFVNKGERFLAAAVRELQEETGFDKLASTMREALQEREIFDHPQRSPRGRLITNVHYFRFNDMEHLPEVHAGDDAKDVRWVNIKDLPAYEDLLFEDHAAILDHFVGLYVEN